MPTTKAKAEWIDRLVSASEHLLTAMTELRCSGRHVSSIHLNLGAVAESIIAQAGALAASEEELRRSYESQIRTLAGRLAGAR